jgi:hypothetical protein
MPSKRRFYHKRRSRIEQPTFDVQGRGKLRGREMLSYIRRNSADDDGTQQSQVVVVSIVVDASEPEVRRLC